MRDRLSIGKKHIKSKWDQKERKKPSWKFLKFSFEPYKLDELFTKFKKKLTISQSLEEF